MLVCSVNDRLLNAKQYHLPCLPGYRWRRYLQHGNGHHGRDHSRGSRWKRHGTDEFYIRRFQYSGPCSGRRDHLEYNLALGFLLEVCQFYLLHLAWTA